jgi:hypothetical protein
MTAVLLTMAATTLEIVKHKRGRQRPNNIKDIISRSGFSEIANNVLLLRRNFRVARKTPTGVRVEGLTGAFLELMKTSARYQLRSGTESGFSDIFVSSVPFRMMR